MEQSTSFRYVKILPNSSKEDKLDQTKASFTDFESTNKTALLSNQ